MKKLSTFLSLVFIVFMIAVIFIVAQIDVCEYKMTAQTVDISTRQ